MASGQPQYPPYNWLMITSIGALGNAVREMRIAKGLSKPDAAKLCRVGRRFLLELESGKTTARRDKVFAVMKGLGITAIVFPGDHVGGMPERG